MALEESDSRQKLNNANVTVQQVDDIDLEVLAKEIYKLLKQNLREEKERLQR